MELQGGQFLQHIENYQKVSGEKIVEESDVIFQQPGLNDFLPAGRDTYVRLMIRTVVGAPGDHGILNSPIILTPYEKVEIDAARKAQLEQDLNKATGNLVVSWDGMSIGKAGSYTAMRFSYTRRLGTKPMVRVEEYLIPNNDRIHYITVSYRIEDKDIWLPALERSLQSLSITKVQ